MRAHGNQGQAPDEETERTEEEGEQTGPTPRFERRRLRNRVCRVSRHTVRARSVRAACGS